MKGFPYGGNATLQRIDKLLGSLGVIVHDHCGIPNCATTEQYRRAKQEILELLLVELEAHRKALKRTHTIK